jgi:hypothetical protein
LILYILYQVKLTPWPESASALYQPSDWRYFTRFFIFCRDTYHCKIFQVFALPTAWSLVSLLVPMQGTDLNLLPCSYLTYHHDLHSGSMGMGYGTIWRQQLNINAGTHLWGYTVS